MKILSVYDSSRARSSLPHFIVFFLTCYVHKLESAQFSVNGPAHPVTAEVGEGIMLPCSLSPGMNAEHMEVRWFRHEFTPFVHLYRRGKDEFGQQMPEYHGRTELLKDSITDGNVDLGILNVRLSDEGQYHCSVQDGDFQEEAVLELKVAALGSAPHISVEGHQDGGIRVVCQSAGWYPQPQVLWRDPRGQPLSASTETKSEEEGGFFKTKNSIVIMENSHKNLSCSMRNTYLDKERKSITFYISDSFFPRASPWMVGWNVTLVILLPFVCLASFLFRVRARQTHQKCPPQDQRLEMRRPRGTLDVSKVVTRSWLSVTRSPAAHSSLPHLAVLQAASRGCPSVVGGIQGLAGEAGWVPPSVPGGSSQKQHVGRAAPARPFASFVFYCDWLTPFSYRWKINLMGLSPTQIPSADQA